MMKKKIKYHQRMRDGIYDFEDKFRSDMIIDLNSVVEGNYKLHFIENLEKTFSVNAYCETKKDQLAISEYLFRQKHFPYLNGEIVFFDL